MSLERPILQKNIFEILFESATAAVEKAGSLAVGAVEGIGNTVSSVGDVFGKVAGVSLGSMFGSSPSTEQSAAKTPAVQEPAAAVAIAPANRPFEVSMSELGGFSAPTFGGAPIGRGSGIGVG